MPPKDDLVYLGHILDTVKKIREKVARKTKDDFDADENLQLALAHLIQIIGEAARHVSQPFRDIHPGIPWPEMIGMRNVIVHQYLELDDDIVWEVATKDLPVLAEKLTQFFPEN